MSELIRVSLFVLIPMVVLFGAILIYHYLEQKAREDKFRAEYGIKD